MSTDFTIANYREQSPDDKCVAIFDIVWPLQYGIIFRNWKLFRGKNGEWIGGPAFYIEDPSGKKNWHPYIEFSKEKNKDFQAKVIEALRPYVK